MSNTPHTSRFFISSNSERGFFGFHDLVFQSKDFEKTYIIQGGPGTGKSSMMRLFSEAGRQIGADCEEILCSSDADSIDGVILQRNGKRVGILDGTAPHTRIPLLPGCKEEILNFGEYWQKARLSEKSEEIILRNAMKQEAYRHAYGLLAAAGRCHTEGKRHFCQYFLSEKAAADIARQAKQLRARGDRRSRYVRAYTMNGEARLADWASGMSLWALQGNTYAAELYLSIFEEIAREKGIEHIRLVSPLQPDSLDGLLFPSDKIAITKAELLENGAEAIRIIRTERFTSRLYKRRAKQEGRFLLKETGRLTEAALSTLRTAAAEHFALEEIYGAAMDFASLKRHFLQMLPQMLSALEG